MHPQETSNADDLRSSAYPDMNVETEPVKVDEVYNELIQMRKMNKVLG